MNMNSPKLSYTKLEVNSFIVTHYYFNNNLKLLSLLLSKLYISSCSLSILHNNREDGYMKFITLLNMSDGIEKPPVLEKISNYITGTSMLKSSEDAYLNLFNLFFKLGISRKKIFFFDKTGPFSRILNVLNWSLHCSTNSNSRKLNTLDYKRFVNKRLIGQIDSDISCILLLPNLPISLKRLILKLKTPYIVYVDKISVHRGDKAISDLSPKHIILISHLYFFYKKGLNSYQKKKLYRSLMLLIRD